MLRVFPVPRLYWLCALLSSSLPSVPFPSHASINAPTYLRSRYPRSDSSGNHRREFLRNRRSVAGVKHSFRSGILIVVEPGVPISRPSGPSLNTSVPLGSDSTFCVRLVLLLQRNEPEFALACDPAIPISMDFRFRRMALLG